MDEGVPSAQGEQKRDAARGDLRVELCAVFERFERAVERLAPGLRLVVVLDQGEADRPLDLGRELAHPGDLEFGSVGVVSGGAGRGDLVDAGSKFSERLADTEELVLGGERAGDGLAVDRAVGKRP